MDQANHGEQYTELLQAQAHVWNHTFNFINSMSLKCAVDLGIPNIIHSHGYMITVMELLVALQINAAKAPFIQRLMRILVHSSFFIVQKLRRTTKKMGTLTNASRFLLKNEPTTVTPILKAMLDPVFDKALAGRDPQFNNFFNDAMASDSQLISKVLINKHREVFEGLSSLVDVGGRTGTLVKALSDAFPHFDCTVFDLPYVVTGLQGRNNLKYVGRDMFDAVLPADTLLLKSILHDWSDKKCMKILDRCKDAIKKNGKLIIIDMVRMIRGDEELIETQLLVDMLMMVVVVTGKERNAEEWSKALLRSWFQWL